MGGLLTAKVMGREMTRVIYPSIYVKHHSSAVVSGASRISNQSYFNSWADVLWKAHVH